MTMKRDDIRNLEFTAVQAAPISYGSSSFNDPAALASGWGLYIDAGVGHMRFMVCSEEGQALFDATVPSGDDLSRTLESWRLRERFTRRGNAFITGKLAELVRETLGFGKTVLPSAAAWMAAGDLMRREGSDTIRSLAVVELSASGYLVVGVGRDGTLRDDLLAVNPRCGAGSGINLDRVLQKLGLGRADVDALLADYAGEAGRERREKTPVRADRCGVFSSSATISDKNQGIPLDVALATTLKSEVLKACRKLPAGYDAACLTGRVFHWRFARDCAEDYLRTLGVGKVSYDADNTQMLKSLHRFVRRVGAARILAPERRLMRTHPAEEYPAMAELERRYVADHHYLRLPSRTLANRVRDADRPTFLALDAGSTMAKAALADADSGDALFLGAYSNSGDTIETVKRVFGDLDRAGLRSLRLRGVGITGSARFQVQQALEHIYPELAGRVTVLVENYAHARGSIALAREHVQRLKDLGVTGINEDFCILVDIGGEDTKISTIALMEAELFGNAMNLKCSAGTGSLMDTRSAMFGLSDVAVACAEAYAAPRGLAINATCAVFLMENARKLQVQGIPRSQILASANWAIVENMARTLWNQLELPHNAVVLLHGQTMLSDPLPVAVTHRLQSYLGAPAYALVPPDPGHRACFGLVQTLHQTAPTGQVAIELAKFLEARFEKRIVQCHGAACEDKSACCNRSQLTCRDDQGHKLISFTIGGCSAVNELLARKMKKEAIQAPVRDTYKEIWDFVASRQPRSESPDRLVIPRSFAVSEWAYLLARVLERLGLPVHVDEVRESDLLNAQPLFNVDTCAPHMGAVGQYRRLAGEPHGLILAPQIEFLPTGGGSLGRTCTLNQGGVAVAMNLAKLACPEARFHLFNLDLSRIEAEPIRAQLQGRLTPVFRHYGLAPEAAALHDAIVGAIEDHLRLRVETADLAADMAKVALDQGVPVALVVGREYVLNPGIYDSHVRRLLRDKHMAVLPSYVLDLELNPDYGHIYWRNPHFIVSLLDAVARRELHQHLRHPGLKEVFRRIETGPSLLPVVQVSTFSCGPDSVVQPFIAGTMKQRPFLLIQSDAVIKELAHLENRVNTYVKQMELGLHERLHTDSSDAFDVRTLDELRLQGPIDKARDVIYFPTMSDNRLLTAVLRGAGYTCIDNYGDGDYDLHGLVKQGRRTAGDAVCAPLAAVWADLERAETDFARRRAAGDRTVAGKERLLYFDNKGTGPCRQGQYADVHKLLYHQRHAQGVTADLDDSGCPALPGQSAFRFLIGLETEGYDIGVEEWVLARTHMGAILQGVLHSLLFTGGVACRDYEEYRRFMADYLALKRELYHALEAFHGPSLAARRVVEGAGRLAGLSWLARYFAYRLNDPALKAPLSRFARTWIRPRASAEDACHIALTGEVYMRVSQAEEVFRLLLANLGFGRFALEYTPAWSYLEWAIDDAVEVQRDRLGRLLMARRTARKSTTSAREIRGRIRLARGLKFILRQLVARPLYRAAGLPMPPSTRKVIKATRELIPTLRPLSEIATYVGEALGELRKGADIVLNVAPNSCMVATMGEVLTPAITAAAHGHGRVQHLFSADGDINDESLTLALLKAMGPERYYSLATSAPEYRENPRPVLPVLLPTAHFH